MQSRPNIYQILKEACEMQGRKVPIQDVRTSLALCVGKKLIADSWKDILRAIPFRNPKP